MERITGDDVDADLFGAGKDGFTAGSPGIAGATVLTPEFCNQIQEELVAGLIEHAGLTPSTSTAQVRAAIAAIAWTFSGFVQCSSASGIAATVGSVKANDDFLYCDAAGASDTRSRTMMIPLTGGVPTTTSHDWAAVLDDGADTHYITTSTPALGDGQLWDVVLPFGCEVTQVRAGVTQGAAGSTQEMRLQIFRSLRDKSAPFASPTVTSLGSDAAAGAGEAVLSVTLSPTFTQGQADTLAVRVFTSDSGASSDRIHWLDISFNDPGPRNF